MINELKVGDDVKVDSKVVGITGFDKDDIFTVEVGYEGGGIAPIYHHVSGVSTVMATKYLTIINSCPKCNTIDEPKDLEIDYNNHYYAGLECISCGHQWDISFVI